MKKCTSLIVAALLASLFVGCSKKPARPTISDFEHPSPKLLQDIASKQGWQIEDVEARQRAFDALESGQQPTDADWQRLVQAADLKRTILIFRWRRSFSHTASRWSQRRATLSVHREAAGCFMLQFPRG